MCAYICVWRMCTVYMDTCGVCYVHMVCVCDLCMCMFLCVSTGTCLCAHVEVWRQPCGSVLTFPPVWYRVSALCHDIHYSGWLEGCQAFSCLYLSSLGRNTKIAGTCFTSSGDSNSGPWLWATWFTHWAILPALGDTLWLNKLTNFSQNFRQGNRISTCCL